MILHHFGRFSAVLAVLCITPTIYGQVLVATPSQLTFRMTADSPILPSAQVIQVTSTGGNVDFEYTGSSTFGTGPGPKFVSVSPMRGTTPATLVVSIDPDVAQGLSGTPANAGYKLLMNLRISGQSATLIVVEVEVIPSLPPKSAISTVVNAGSRRSGPIAPGEIITILGTSLCPLKDRSRVVEGIPGSRIFYYLSESGGTRVMINGVAVPILYCEGGQVNAVVPYDIAVPSRAEIVVSHYGVESNAVSIEVTDTAPAILSLNQSGDGQGLIINANRTLNSSQNPAKAGETVQIFASGAGQMVPRPLAGLIVRPVAGVTSVEPPAKPTAPVSLTIGGKAVEIKFAGTVPDFINSVLLIEAVMPEGLARGPQPMFLKIGANTNAVQHITVAQ